MTDGKSDEALDYAQLLEELGMDDAACITSVTGADEDAVIRCFGGDPGGSREYGPLDDDFIDRCLDDDRQLIAVAQAGGAVVVIEIDGFEGAREEVLRPLSRLGRTASAYWGEDAMSRLSLAVDGEVLSAFELLFPQRRQGSRPDAWSPFLPDLTVGTDGIPRSAGLRAVARATGARLGHDLADRAFRIVAIEPVPEAVLPQGWESSPLLSEQPYARYLADLGPHLLPEMRHHAFDLALRHTELTEDSLAHAAIAALEHPPPTGPDPSRLRHEVAAARAAAQPDRPVAPSQRAVDLPGRRTELWALLDYLLSDPAVLPAAVLHLQRVMTGESTLVDRYWLLNRLYGAAKRGGTTGGRTVGGGKMHEDEVETDVALVRRLLVGQFPRWAGLPVERVESAGTVNAVYRLGADMSVRLPLIEGGARDVAKEARWLPRLAPLLPVAIPVPLGVGEPAEGFPWPWSVHPWLDGETPVPGRIADPDGLARDLAGFVGAFRQLGQTGGLTGGLTGGPLAYRHEPLRAREKETRAAIGSLGGVIDTALATAAWEAALAAPEWPGPGRWVHADLSPGNVLLSGGRLSAVIDFGCAGEGEPAVDLIPAWSLLTPGAREIFRTTLAVDDADWARGRGWALSIALIELAYYRTTNPVMASTARHVIEQVLAEHAHGG